MTASAAGPTTVETQGKGSVSATNTVWTQAKAVSHRPPAAPVARRSARYRCPSTRTWTAAALCCSRAVEGCPPQQAGCRSCHSSRDGSGSDPTRPPSPTCGVVSPPRGGLEEGRAVRGPDDETCDLAGLLAAVQTGKCAAAVGWACLCPRLVPTAASIASVHSCPAGYIWGQRSTCLG